MNPVSQRIETECTACVLHEHCYTVGMNSIGPIEAPLKIFLDAPPKEDDQRHKFGESNIAKFVRWMMARNSLKEEDYQICFTLKCAIPKNFLTKKENKLECIDACAPHRIASLQNTKCVLAMGELSALAFLGLPLKKVVHCFWPMKTLPWFAPALQAHIVVTGASVGVCYAPGYAIVDPSEAVSMSRMMWMAGEKAGLKPAFNPKAGFFDFQVI